MTVNDEFLDRYKECLDRAREENAILRRDLARERELRSFLTKPVDRVSVFIIDDGSEGCAAVYLEKDQAIEKWNELTSKGRSADLYGRNIGEWYGRMWGTQETGEQILDDYSPGWS